MLVVGAILYQAGYFSGSALDFTLWYFYNELVGVAITLYALRCGTSITSRLVLR
jgi:hypothetical protein